MRITDLEVLSLPDGGTAMVVAVVHTDTGLYGLGEIGLRDRHHAVRGALTHLRELVVGQDPTRIEHLWQVMSRNGFYPADRVVASAVAAVDVALWDLAGKRLDVPMYELLGGRVRDHVPAYTHVGADSDDPEALVEACRRLVAAGWRHLRFAPPQSGTLLDPRASMRQTVRQLKAAREALGDEVELILDVHTRFDPPDALTLCREIEPLRPYFVEDPLRAEGLENYRMLRLRSGVPLAAGEQFASKWEFRRVIEEDLIDFARIDIGNAGGLTEARKIAGWCEAHYIGIATHVPIGPINTAAAAHFDLATSNARLQEYTQPPDSVAGAIFGTGVHQSGGRLTVERRPGLGVTVDLPAARAQQAITSERPPLHRPDGSYTNW